MSKMLFTSESVTEGHPDKVCDRVSDAILDAILAQDEDARVACDTFATTGIVTVMGEISTTAQVDITKSCPRYLRRNSILLYGNLTGFPAYNLVKC